MRLAFHALDDFGRLTAASIDYKVAHKQKEYCEQGALLFRAQGKLYGYPICLFGARFSAYWWQRTGACITCLLRCILCHMPHILWLYVDDLLAALLQSSPPLQLTIMVETFASSMHQYRGRKGTLETPEKAGSHTTPTLQHSSKEALAWLLQCFSCKPRTQLDHFRRPMHLEKAKLLALDGLQQQIVVSGFPSNSQ